MDFKMSAKEVTNALQSYTALKGYDADTVIYHWEKGSFAGATIKEIMPVSFTTESIIESIRKG